MVLNYHPRFLHHPTAANPLHRVARTLPLIAAIFAPISTLLDIPALTQRWYLLNSGDFHVFRHDACVLILSLVPQRDFTASLVLSVIGLTFNVLANALLIIRFSTGERWWRVATYLSTICWIVKVRHSRSNLPA
jgi:potassium channel subfamily K